MDVKPGGWVDTINNIGYYNLKLGTWILLQFKVESNNNISLRAKFGDRIFSEWKPL